MLPEFNADGHLPAGVHSASLADLRSRFGCANSRRVWLFQRLESLVGLASASGKLRRVFVWGSFVTARPQPKDIDLLLIMSADFELGDMPSISQGVFESARAKLLFNADVFWARESIGPDVLSLWLDTYQTSRTFQKRGIVELEIP